jgi:hypothetical protein
MELTPEERHKIYEEEKARLEALEKLERGQRNVPPPPSPEPPAPPAPAPSRGRVGSERKTGIFWDHLRDNRIRSSVIAIAWSIVFLVLFSYFYDYFAYYHATGHGWERTPFLNGDYTHWLPLLTATLLIIIACHVVLIMYDSYTLRQVLSLVMGVLGLATAVTLLAIFPFDFHVLPGAGLATGLDIGLRVILALISLAVGINFLVRLIKFVISVVKGRADYGKAI